MVIPAGERFVLRLSGHRARGLDDVEAGTTFAAHLVSAGVRVPAAVPTWTGALFTAADLPDGWRPAVLFHHAESRPPDLDGRDDARLQRMTLVRIIEAARAFTARTPTRFRLDRDHLLHCQAAAVLALVIAPLDSFSGICARQIWAAPRCHRRDGTNLHSLGLSHSIGSRRPNWAVEHLDRFARKRSLTKQHHAFGGGRWPVRFEWFVLESSFWIGGVRPKANRQGGSLEVYS